MSTKKTRKKYDGTLNPTSLGVEGRTIITTVVPVQRYGRGCGAVSVGTMKNRYGSDGERMN